MSSRPDGNSNSQNQFAGNQSKPSSRTPSRTRPRPKTPASSRPSTHTRSTSNSKTRPSSKSKPSPTSSSPNYRSSSTARARTSSAIRSRPTSLNVRSSSESSISNPPKSKTPRNSKNKGISDLASFIGRSSLAGNTPSGSLVSGNSGYSGGASGVSRVSEASSQSSYQSEANKLRNAGFGIATSRTQGSTNAALSKFDGSLAWVKQEQDRDRPTTNIYGGPQLPVSEESGIKLEMIAKASWSSTMDHESAKLSSLSSSTPSKGSQSTPESTPNNKSLSSSSRPKNITKHVKPAYVPARTPNPTSATKPSADSQSVPPPAKRQGSFKKVLETAKASTKPGDKNIKKSSTTDSLKGSRHGGRVRLGRAKHRHQQTDQYADLLNARAGHSPRTKHPYTDVDEKSADSKGSYDRVKADDSSVSSRDDDHANADKNTSSAKPAIHPQSNKGVPTYHKGGFLTDTPNKESKKSSRRRKRRPRTSKRLHRYCSRKRLQTPTVNDGEEDNNSEAVADLCPIAGDEVKRTKRERLKLENQKRKRVCIILSISCTIIGALTVLLAILAPRKDPDQGDLTSNIHIPNAADPTSLGNDNIINASNSETQSTDVINATKSEDGSNTANSSMSTFTTSIDDPITFNPDIAYSSYEDSFETGSGGEQVFAGLSFPYSYLLYIPPETSSGPSTFIQPNLPSGISDPMEILQYISGSEIKLENSPRNYAAQWLLESDKVPLPPTDSRFVQRYVMAVLYYSLNGENWERSEGWMGQDDICHWQHVCCMDRTRSHCMSRDEEIYERRVTIQLVNNNLEGTIPHELGWFTDLYQINLQSNRIHGQIPSTISELKKLELFAVGSNNLDGYVPEELWSLDSLLGINLFGNKFEGSFSSKIGNLYNLALLDISDNAFTGALPESLGQAKNLISMNLGENEFVGQLPSSLYELKKLRDLRLYENAFSGQIVEDIQNLDNLEMLAIFSNKFSGSFPSTIDKCSQLKSLEVHNNLFDGEIPSSIGNLILLERLFLDDNHFRGTLPISLSELHNLQYLDAYNNELTGSIPQEFGYLSNLYGLYLHGNRLDQRIPSTFQKLQQLEELKLHDNHLTGELDNTLWLMPRLKLLDLHNNDLKGTIPKSANLLELEYLDIENNIFTGEFPAASFSVSSPNLQYLYLRNNGFSGSTGDYCSTSTLRAIMGDCSTCSCCTDCSSLSPTKRRKAGNLRA